MVRPLTPPFLTNRWARVLITEQSQKVTKGFEPFFPLPLPQGRKGRSQAVNHSARRYYNKIVV